MAVWEKEEGLVVVPRNRELCQKIIEACHDGPIAGHPG